MLKCYPVLHKINNSISRTFKETHYNIQLAFSVNNTLNRLCLKPNSQIRCIDKLVKSGIYKRKCGDCPKCYIGQTGRTFQQRFKDHIPKSTNPQTSTLAEQLIKENQTTNQSKKISKFCYSSKILKLNVKEENLQPRQPILTTY